MSEPDEYITWTSSGTGTVGGYSQSIKLTSSPPWSTTTATPWSAGADPQMIKAHMTVVVQRLEQLQQRIRELEAKLNG